MHRHLFAIGENLQKGVVEASLADYFLGISFLFYLVIDWFDTKNMCNISYFFRNQCMHRNLFKTKLTSGPYKVLSSLNTLIQIHRKYYDIFHFSTKFNYHIFITLLRLRIIRIIPLFRHQPSMNCTTES